MNNIYESNNYDISFRGILSDNNSLKIFTNNDFIEVNNEISFDMNSDYKSSINYFSSSILGGIIHSLLSQSKRSSIDIEEIEGKIHLTLKNPLSTLGVKGYNEEPIISNCKITIYLYSDNDDNNVLEFCYNSLSNSFIYNTLKNSIDINVKFILID